LSNQLKIIITAKGIKTMKNFRDRFWALREEMIEYIKKAIETCGKGVKEIDLMEIEYDNCPIISDSGDDETTFVLDKITITDKGLLVFDGSSSWENGSWDENIISTDALYNICNEIDYIAQYVKNYKD
jgi:hypothetical protein